MSKHKTFIELVEEKCLKYKKKTALYEDTKRVSYGKLWDLSGRVYRALGNKHIGPEDVVMISLGSVIDEIITMIGVLRAGAAFVMAGNEHYGEDAGSMYADCGCRMLIKEQTFTKMLEEKSKEGFEAVSEHTAAYVILTSGTIEKPKGVKIERGAMSLCGRTIGIEPQGDSSRQISFASKTFCSHGESLLGEGDRVALFAPLTFTAGMIVVNVSLVAGAQLFIASHKTITDLMRLESFIFENRITHCFMTPSLFKTMRGFNPEMKVIALSGEKLENAGRSDVLILNMYGQTESGYVLAMFGADCFMQTVPVGRPQLPEIDIRILSSKGEPVKEGEIGEICYHAPYFREYTGDRKKTRFAKRNGIFHSGDMGMMLPDGNIVVLGRNDDMVKIGGIRVEPAMIEAAILKKYAADQVAVRCITDEKRVFICVYYTGDVVIERDEARKRLLDMLKPVMLPTHFFHLDSILVNQNGKTDFLKLPLPPDIQSIGDTDQPKDEIDRQVCNIAGEVMGLDMPLKKSSNLISLGLSSIRAIELIGRLEEKYHIQLDLNDLINCPDVGHICKLVKSRRMDRYTERNKIQIGGEYFPLTKSQLGILAECESNKNTVQYNIPGYYTFDYSEIDIGKLKELAMLIFELHPALNIRLFPEKEVPQAERRQGCGIYQKITHAEPVFKVIYLEDELPADAEREYFQKKVVPFELFGERLYRIEIIVTPTKQYLFMDAHHIISDGFSIGVIADDIRRFLKNEAPRREVMSFREYTFMEEAYAKSDTAKADEKYFKELLSGVESFKYPYTVSDTDGLPHRIAELRRVISDEGISRFCRANGLTKSSYFHSAILLVLYLLTRELPLIVTTYNGRTRLADRLMRTCGLVARSIPVVLKTDGRIDELSGLSPSELVAQIQRQIMENCSHDSVIYSDLTQRSDVMFTYQGELANPQINGRIAADLIQETPKFPVTIEIRPQGSIFEIVFSYDFSLFAERDMLLLLDSYVCMLRKLCKVETLGEASLTKTDGVHLPKYTLGRSVHIDEASTWVGTFKKQAAASPEHCAVFAENGRYSYRELDVISDKIAVYLTEKGVMPGDRIAVKMDRVKEFTAAVLGIHKCGAAYVPIDIDYPQSRMDYILNDSGAKITLTRETVVSLSSGEHTPFEIKTDPCGDAYIIYTSGSTGQPKGVVIQHRALYNYLIYIVREMRLDTNSRLAVYASFSFDISAEGLFSPLMAGGASFIVPTGCRKDIDRLEDFLAENKITGGCFPTQVGQLIGQKKTVDLKYISLIGEKMTQIPDITGDVYNSYGPTEFAVACTYYKIEKGRKYSDIPIGKPMYNTSVLIADPFGNILPVGALGEIFLSGIQIARCYHKRPKKTEQAFISLRGFPQITAYRTGDLGRYMPDGNLVFSGRTDRQLKRRGYRIEPGEIETEVRTLPEIREAVVIQKGNALVLYYTMNSENVVDENKMTQKMADRLEASLPPYMLPDGYMYLDKMPYSTNGKIDIKRLPGYCFAAEGYVAPRSSFEGFVCEKMMKILGAQRVGIKDDFFAIGGDSISAVMLAGELGDGYEIRDIYQGRTPEGIVKTSQQKRRVCGFKKRSVYPLCGEQKKYFYDDRKDKVLERVDMSFSNVPCLIRLPQDTNLEKLCSMLIKIVNNHPYLKVRYMRDKTRAAGPGEQFAAKRDDDIPACVSIIHTEELDREGLIKPFDLLGDDNLYRITLYDVQGKEKYLFLDFCHILIDGASLKVMGSELARLMEGKELTLESATGYDVALEEELRRNEELKRNEEYYHELLKDCSKNTMQWIESRKDPETEKERYRRFNDSHNRIKDVLVSRTVCTKKCRVNMKEIRKMCRILRITENMLFNAVFACLIGECNGMGEAFYTTVISNRNNAALDNTVTMLCRTVPVYLKVKEDMLGTKQFISTLKSVVTNANIGGVLTVPEICRLNGLSAPSVSMLYRENPVDEEFISGWRQEEIDCFSSVEELMVKIYYHTDGGLFLHFDAYMGFSAQEIEQMAGRLDEIICGLISGENQL